MLVSCSSNFDITQHYDAKLPFKIIDVELPNSDATPQLIVADDLKHQQLVTWLKANNNGWQKADHNTHAGLVIVSQQDFRLIFYRDNDFIVCGYDDTENNMQQYIRKMDSNELRFLLDY